MGVLYALYPAHTGRYNQTSASFWSKIMKNIDMALKINGFLAAARGLGRLAALNAALGVSPTAWKIWKKKGAPLARAVEIEKLCAGLMPSGHRLTRADINRECAACPFRPVGAGEGAIKPKAKRGDGVDGARS